MEGPIYRSKFAALKIETVTPNRRARERIDRIIFDELVRGQVTVEASCEISAIIEEMRRENCDALGLCCTELPLLVSSFGAALPLLDSTRLLALAAIEKCGGLRR